MFHDGRLSVSDEFESGFNSPAEEWLPSGFNSILAAQAVFPLVAQFEMAGNPKENEIAGAVHDRIDAAWPILAKRVRVTGDYGARFVEAFDHLDEPEDVTIVDIANALAAFMGTEWRSFDSPYDAYIAGDADALDRVALNGFQLFFGDANCASCHSGPLLSDHDFHALGLPPFGPGRTRVFDPFIRDVGRMGESDALEDAYRFRPPSLRNVSLTAPYGHNGAYPTLEGIIRHHLDPVDSRQTWTPDMAALPSAPHIEAIDFVVFQDKREMARQARALDIEPQSLSDEEIDALVAFPRVVSIKSGPINIGELPDKWQDRHIGQIWFCSPQIWVQTGRDFAQKSVGLLALYFRVCIFETDGVFRSIQRVLERAVSLFDQVMIRVLEPIIGVVLAQSPEHNVITFLDRLAGCDQHRDCRLGGDVEEFGRFVAQDDFTQFGLDASRSDRKTRAHGVGTTAEGV